MEGKDRNSALVYSPFSYSMVWCVGLGTALPRRSSRMSSLLRPELLPTIISIYSLSGRYYHITLVRKPHMVIRIDELPPACLNSINCFEYF